LAEPVVDDEFVKAKLAMRTVFPSVAASAMCLKNSKNCVARTIEYGIDESLISFSCSADDHDLNGGSPSAGDRG
jgi:hypothetical protein